ncbi:hypothetical protein [Rubrivirga sp.]|uniref:hypothetical protein n=1 Tax=Rubrivirga sp. TaxID=1885344 RepID=UPI003C73A621
MQAAALLADGPEVEIWNGLGSLPLFSPGLEVAPSVLDLRGRVADADAVLIIAPEYAQRAGRAQERLRWAGLVR